MIGYEGSLSIADADFELQATGCPPNQFGIFYYGSSRIQVPFGSGYRCVGGEIFRLPILNTGPTGTASYLVDFLNAPANQIDPFDPVDFQFWYRDCGTGGCLFNLSDAMEVMFCP